MFCSNCGNKLADGSNFCNGCGAKVGVVNDNTKKEQNESTVSIPIAAQTYFEQGKKYQEKEDWNNALNSYNAAIKIAPSFSEAQKRLVEVALKFKGNEATAENIINDVISKNPNDYEAFLVRGRLYAFIGDIEKAMMDYNIALKLHPDYLDAYKGILFVYQHLKDYDNIINISNKAIEIDNNDYTLFLLRGLAFYHKNIFDNAINDYNRVLEILPDNSNALSSIAHCYFNKKDYDNAILFFNRFFEKTPDNVDCMYLRGQCYFFKEEYEKALEDFKLVEEHYKEKTNPKLYLYQTKARFNIGWYKYHHDDIMYDYLQLQKNKDQYEHEDLGFFIDIMLDRYKTAINKFKGEKKTYLIAEQSEDLFGKSKYENYLLMMFPTDNPQVVKKSNQFALAFIDYDFAYCYEKLLINHTGSKSTRFHVENNIKSGTPKYWFIFHAGSGLLYYKNGAGKRNSTWTAVSEDQSFRYESLEDVFKDYEEIIRSEYLCNRYIDKGGNTIQDKLEWVNNENYLCYSNNFMEVFVAGIGGTEEIVENTAEIFVQKGDEFYSKKDFEKAIIEFTRAIEIEPSFYRAYTQRARAYAMLKDFDKAITDYSTIINACPDDVEAYANRANEYETKNDLNNAINDLIKVYEIDPEFICFNASLWDLYEKRGDEYFNSEDYSRAIEDYNNAINTFKLHGSDCFVNPIDDLLEKISNAKEKG